MKVHLCTCRDTAQGQRMNNDRGMRALRAARVRLWRPCGAGGHRTRGRAPPTHRARRLQLIRTQNIPLSPFSRWVKPPHIKCRPLIVANRVMCCKKRAAKKAKCAACACVSRLISSAPFIIRVATSAAARSAASRVRACTFPSAAQTDRRQSAQNNSGRRPSRPRRPSAGCHKYRSRRRALLRARAARASALRRARSV